MNAYYELIRRKSLLASRAASFSSFEHAGFHPLPLKVKLLITDRCELRCRHCNLWDQERKTELNASDYERFFNNNPFISMLSISGGEPFMRSDINEILECAMRLPNIMVLTINTNGYNTDKIVSSLEKIAGSSSGAVKIHVFVSVDGPQEVHDAMRGRAGSHERAERTIRRLRDLRSRGIVVWRNVCATPDNLNGMKEYLLELSRADEPVNLSFYQCSKRYGHTDEHRRMAADFYKNLVGQMREWPVDKLKMGLIQRSFLKRAIKFYAGDFDGQALPCFSGAASLIINSYGDIFPCVSFSRKMGSIADSECDLRTILLREEATRTRSLIKNNNCPSCWTPNEAYITTICNWRKTILDFHQ